MSMIFWTGAWLIHIVLICLGKVIIDTIPGMTQQVSWTLVNLCYLAVRQFLLFSLLTAINAAFEVVISYVPLGNGHSI
jgi:ORMDL family